MIVKVVYLNNSFEFVYDVKSIEDDGISFVLHLENDHKLRYDRRLKLIVGNYEDAFHEPKHNCFW